ncbi:MAG: DegV family protein [Anaerolineae bacterium]|jgi:DegV family protein with EDD domain
MSNARIVTDSTAELSADIVRELDITVVPWQLTVGFETMMDDPSLRSVAFYKEMIRKKASPTAVAPTVRQLQDVYNKLAVETDEIISIHASSEMGRTVQAATQARAALLGRCDVTVIDSRFISCALGMLVTEAARAAQHGLSGAEIARMVYGMIPRTYFAFYVETLDYLKRNGLVTNSREMAGSAGFKPLLLLEEGEVVAMQRSRHRGTPAERLIEFVSEFPRVERAVLLHAGLSNSAEEVKTQATEALPDITIDEHIYGPVFGSYVGPGALGMVVFEA